ncbi:lipopolysaccharide biosynthesis protein [Abyssalbus ytuae]|uniref:Oligosaccharide flippase family protein n=1 Tax=Abyssalbus ytuae TaxID=2926907 RepID=A0A9E7CSY5_9FLAO|nr:oligosaccharide flippase family protein [Abyssalbus ytuae]UOB17081.1 oligosaccharide flippase family protein [Abyssalbus ytuae]
MSQLEKGAILNYLNIFLTNIIGLLLTPFIIKKLGDAEFGLYSLIGAFVGYMSVLDLGINNTIIRFVAKYRAEKNRIGEENFLATTMIIYFFISLLIIAIGTICYYNLDSIFGSSLTIEEMGKAKIMFVILIFNLAVTLPGGAFAGICSGYEEFVFPKTVNIFRYIVRAVLIVALLILGGKAISIVILDTSLNLFIIGVNAFFVLNKLKVKFKFHNIEKSLIKEIFGYSIWIFIAALVSQFQWQAGQMALGIVANTTIVAIYAVGIMLGTYYGAFSHAISGVFLPRATQMTVRNATGEELTTMMIKIGRISLIILLYILGAFLLYGKQFVFLWVGENYYNSWVVALIIMFAYTMPLVQSFGNSILEAKNKMSFKVIIYLIFIGMGTFAGVLLAKKYGSIGMITGSTIGWIISQNILNVYYQKVIHLNIIRFFKELFNKTFIVFILIIPLGYLINYIPGEGWISFIIKAFSYTFVFATLMFSFGMNSYEKQLFEKPIQNTLKKLKIKS